MGCSSPLAEGAPSQQLDHRQDVATCRSSRDAEKEGHALPDGRATPWLASTSAFSGRPPQTRYERHVKDQGLPRSGGFSLRRGVTSRGGIARQRTKHQRPVRRHWHPRRQNGLSCTQRSAPRGGHCPSTSPPSLSLMIPRLITRYARWWQSYGTVAQLARRGCLRST